MLYAFKLGPIRTKEASFFAHVAMTDGKIAPPVMGRPDAEALTKLALHGKGQELLCELSLASAGLSAGFKPAPFPDWVLIPRASLSVILTYGRAGTHLRDPRVIPALLSASAAFWKNAPWRHWANEEPLIVRVSGFVEQEYEGSILGNAGQEFGVALYDEPGTIERLLSKDTSDVSGLAVTLSADPPWVAKAVEDAFGAAVCPFSLRVEGGRPSDASQDEVLILGTTLRAVADLSPERLEVTQILTGFEKELAVHVQAQPPASYTA